MVSFVQIELTILKIWEFKVENYYQKFGQKSAIFPKNTAIIKEM